MSGNRSIITKCVLCIKIGPICRTNNHIEQIIAKAIKEKRQRNVKELKWVIQRNKETSGITELLTKLLSNGKMRSQRKNSYRNLSSISKWYWLVIIILLVSVVSIFFVPSVYPFSFFRIILGLIFLLFLPGYVFLKAIYPNNLSINAYAQDIDKLEIDSIERFVLSIGLSLALTSMVGIVLYYTPFGIGIMPLTLSLIILTAVLSDLAILRERS